MRKDEIHQFVLYLVSKWRWSFYEHALHREDYTNILSTYESLLSKGTAFDLHFV